MLTLRGTLLVMHRYVGLAIATFLLVAAGTGSLLSFYHELDAALNPALYRVAPPTPDAKPLDPFVLRERVMRQLPGVPLNEVVLDLPHGEPLALWIDQGGNADNEYFADPYTGTLLGSRHWGDLAQGSTNLMPFAYRLHYQLALGEVGSWLFGIIALLWTFDCFIGMYLTFPARRAGGAATGQRSWLARWKPSWLVRGGSLFGGIFTFHRASGLWAWPLLLVFAWSAVGFNLNPVFTPVMNTFFTTAPSVWDTLPTLEQPREKPALEWAAALDHGRRLMAEQAMQRAFTVNQETGLSYEPSQGLYRYDVKSSLDITARRAGTRLWFDGDSGALAAFDAPSGLTTGNTVGNWLYALHMGTVGGLAYRIVVCVLGLVIAALCVTGVIIWWEKSRLRRKARKARVP